MALDGTFTGLCASVADFLDRQDLTAAIPDFVRLCEAQLNRRLKTRDMWTTIPIPVTTQTFPLPQDLLAVETIRTPENWEQKLQYVTPQQMDAKRPDVTGPAREYTIAGGCFVFWPAPDQSVTMQLRYRRALPALSSYTPTNWLLFKHPDAYLYGSLMQSAPYLKDDARIEVWSGLFEAAVAQIEAQDQGLVEDTLEMRSGITDGHRWDPWGVYPSSGVF